jgi:hypothetical protein
VQIRRVKGVGGVGPVPVEVWVALGMGAVLGVPTVAMALRHRFGAALMYVVLLAVMAGVPFAEYSDRRRAMRSGVGLARQLQAEIPDGATVTTAAFLLDQPEVFWYLNGRTGRYEIRTLDQFALRNTGGFGEEGGWYLLNEKEVKAADRLPTSRVMVRKKFKSNSVMVTLLELRAATDATTMPATQGSAPRD